MAIGPLEILLFALISVIAIIVALFQGRKPSWLVAACFGLAMVATPADLGSMLLAATLMLLLIWGIHSIGTKTRAS